MMIVYPDLACPEFIEWAEGNPASQQYEKI